MIVLDTNVISEPLKPNGSPVVRAWLNAQTAESLYTTTLNLAELFAGVAALPIGKRRHNLNARVRASLLSLFDMRILTFDFAAAEAYATIAEEAKSTGVTVPHDDGLIAAIARARGYTLATRNVSHFAGTGLTLINPWDAAA